MAFSDQQHLAPNDLATLQRALARVEAALHLESNSEERNYIAAAMVREFQLGTHTEERLVEIFLGK